MATVSSTLSLVDNMTPTLTKTQQQAIKNIEAFNKMSKEVDSLTKSLEAAEKANPNIVKTEGYATAVSAIEKMKGRLYEAANGQTKFNTEVGEGTGKVNKLTSAVKAFTIASLATKAIAKIFSLITGQIDSAIKRYDTLNNYTNVMSNLGIAEEAAQASKERLSEGLKGLPTTLDAAVLGVQRLTATNSDVEASTEMFLALNNAILAGGADIGLQQTAIEQMTQAYAKGKPDMMEWRSLQQAMPGQLKQIAKAMDRTTEQLGEDLRSGKVSMNDFMATVVKLNQEGIDGFANFEEQAKKATGGIQTSIANMKSAISRGLVTMIDNANTALEASGLPTIQEMIYNLGMSIESVLGYIGTTVIPTFITGLSSISVTIQGVLDDIVTMGGTVEDSSMRGLTALDYLYIGFQMLMVGINVAVSAIRVAMQFMWVGILTACLGALSAWHGLQTGVEGVIVAIVLAVQGMVNKVIGLINMMIDAFNTAFGAFGANAQHIEKATFGDEAVSQFTSGVSARYQEEQDFAGQIAQAGQYALDLADSTKSSWIEGGQSILDAVQGAVNNKASGQSSTSRNSTPYDYNKIANLANGVTAPSGSGGSGGGGGKALKTTSTDKNLLSDDDIQLLLDVATRDYKLNYQQITPNITLTFGDVRETADVDDVLDKVAERLEEIYDSNLEVSA